LLVVSALLSIEEMIQFLIQPKEGKQLGVSEK
jgi:hypothetical protein